MLASVNLKEVKMRAIHVTNEELYEFVKLYDLLRDMDFELTENQTNVFDKVLTITHLPDSMEDNSND